MGIRELCRRHVRVAGEQDRGSAMDNQQEQRATGQKMPLAAAGVGASGHRKRIFLADDHRLVREGLVELLEKTGHFEIVGQCSSGLQVVGLVDQTQPDLVLLDVELPGMSGIDVCTELKRRLPNTAVLMLSMYSTDACVILALQNGAGGYLLKDSACTDLVEAIGAVMNGQIYLDPTIDDSVLSRLHQPRTDPYDRLSPRERQVLQMISEGLTNRMIADKLGRSVKTIDVHRTRLMRKLDIHDQTTLVKFYLSRNGGLGGGGTTA